MGGGYFRANKSGFIFESYGGVGFGNARTGSATLLGSFGWHNDANFMKYYVQPSFGYKTNVLELAISWRLAALDFTSISGSGLSNANAEELAAIQMIQSNPASFLSEPAVTARLGFKVFKIQAQWGWSSNLSHPNYPQAHEYLNLGLFFSIDGIKKE